MQKQGTIYEDDEWVMDIDWGIAVKKVPEKEDKVMKVLKDGKVIEVIPSWSLEPSAPLSESMPDEWEDEK